MDECLLIKRSINEACPCWEFHYHGRIFILDSGWNLAYQNSFLPPIEAFRELPSLSQYDKDQLNQSIVTINGELFINHKPFIIAYDLSLIDWASVDSIFISYIDSFLLLPIILRETAFSGKVYTTHMIYEIAMQYCESMISTPTSSSQEINHLLHRIPKYQDNIYHSYQPFSKKDVNCLKDIIHCMNIGEVVELNKTISIQCISINQGSTKCGWLFKPIYGEKPNQRDLLYIPFNEKLPSTISQSSSISFINQIKYICIGGSYTIPLDSLTSLSDVYTFIQNQKTDNRNLLIIASINDTLLEVIEAILHGCAFRGKPLSVYFIDTPQSTYFHALSSYLQHPEILHDDYRKRIIAGFAPFYTFDHDCKDITVNICPTRIRSSSVYILPDSTLLSLFPSSFFTYDNTLDILVLSSSIQIQAIKALFPFSTNIHCVHCVNGLFIDKEDQRIVSTQRNQKIKLDVMNAFFCPINIQIGKASQSITEKLSSKRKFEIPNSGFKRIAYTSDVVQFVGTKLKKDKDWILQLKEALEQKGYSNLLVENNTISISDLEARIIISENEIEIELANNNPTIYKDLYSICNSI